MATSERLSDERLRKVAVIMDSLYREAMDARHDGERMDAPDPDCLRDAATTIREVLALREQRDEAVAIAREAVDGLDCPDREVRGAILGRLADRLAQIGGKDA